MAGLTCADRMKHEKYADFDFFEYIADETKGVEWKESDDLPPFGR